MVSDRASANGRVRTLVHELAHALGVDYTDYSREEAEVIVESAATIVCGSLGLDTSGESVPYIAGWGHYVVRLMPLGFYVVDTRTGDIVPGPDHFGAWYARWEAERAARQLNLPRTRRATDESGACCNCGNYSDAHDHGECCAVGCDCWEVVA